MCAERKRGARGWGASPVFQERESNRRTERRRAFSENGSLSREERRTRARALPQFPSTSARPKTQDVACSLAAELKASARQIHTHSNAACAMRLHLSGWVALGSVPAGVALLLLRRWPPGALAAGWVAAAGFAVSLAASPPLAAVSTGLLGKNTATGALPLWSRLAFAPYHSALRLRLASTRARSAEPRADAIVGTDWYLGGWPAAPGDLPPGVVAILDVTAELPRTVAGPGLPYRCLPVWDTWAPATPAIQASLDWAAAAVRAARKKEGGRVYVHCANGHGRSAVLAVARVLEGGGGGGTVDGAVAVVQCSRPRSLLNLRNRAAELPAWARRPATGK